MHIQHRWKTHGILPCLPLHSQQCWRGPHVQARVQLLCSLAWQRSTRSPSVDCAAKAVLSSSQRTRVKPRYTIANPWLETTARLPRPAARGCTLGGHRPCRVQRAVAKCQAACELNTPAAAVCAAYRGLPPTRTWCRGRLGTPGDVGAQRCIPNSKPVSWRCSARQPS
jgi:hypothetical protein